MEGCLEKAFKALISKIESGVSATAVGDTFLYPIYDFETQKEVGHYADASTYIFSGNEVTDFMFIGSFNLDYDETFEFPFASQIMMQGTCQDYSNAITGGTGAYEYASGTAELVGNDGESFVNFLLSVCDVYA
jgi:hypothetical protein